MAVAIQLTDSAKGDLSEIRAFYHRKESPEIARAVLVRIRAAMESLAHLPDRGHHVPEMLLLGVRKFREIHASPFRIIYEPTRQSVVVHAVLDARRDLRDILAGRLP